MEFLFELPAHGLIQLFNDLFQFAGGIGQIVVLALLEGIPLHQLPVFFNGVDIDTAQILYPSFEFADLSPHGGQVRQGRIAQGGRLRHGESVFLPHVGDQAVDLFPDPFPGGGQPQQLLIQGGCTGGQFLPVREAFLLTDVQSLSLLLITAQEGFFLIPLTASPLHAGPGLLNGLFLFRDVLPGAADPFLRFRQLCPQVLQFLPDPVRVLAFIGGLLIRFLQFQFPFADYGLLVGLCLLQGIQLFFQAVGVPGQGLLPAAGLADGSAGGFEFLLQGRGLGFQFLLLPQDFFPGACCFLLLLLFGNDIHTGRILGQHATLQLHPQGLGPGPQAGPVLFDLLDPVLDLFLFLLIAGDPVPELGHFPPSAQEVAAAAEGTAADGAAGGELFPLQRDHTDPAAVFAAYGYRPVIGVDNDDPAQQVRSHRPEPLLCLQQGIRRSDHAFLSQDPGVPEALSFLNIRKGQESGPAGLAVLEHTDHAARRGSVVRDDILDPAAQGDLYGGLVLLICFKKVGNDADQARFPFFLFHDPADTAAEALIAFGHIDQGIQSGLFLMVGQLDPAQILIRRCQQGLFAVDGFRRLFLLLPQADDPAADLLELILVFPDLLFLLLFTVLDPVDPMGQLLPPFAVLFLAGGQACLTGLQGASLLDDMEQTVPGLFQAVIDLQGPGLDITETFKGLPALPAQALQLLLHLPGAALDGLEFLLLAVHLVLQAAPASLIMLHGLPGRADLFLKEADIRFQFAADNIRPGDPVPGLPDLSVSIGDLFLDLPVFLTGQVVALPGFLQIVPGDLFFFVQLFQPGGMGLIVHQEHIDLQTFHFLPGIQIDLCLLRLLLQRSHLALQFGQDIPDPDQVLLFTVQLADRGHFAPLELDNAGGFIEKLPAVLRLVGQDPVDLALTDDGIAFLADAGIVEHLIDIPQPAGQAVDHVFALTAAVKTPGYCDLVIRDRQDMVRIVQRNRHIGKAQGPPQLGAGKNDILHGMSPQLFDLLLAQNPADRVGDIALAAAVGADDGRDPVMEFELYFVCEGFKSLYFYTFKIHIVSVSLFTEAGPCQACRSRMALTASKAACCSAFFLDLPRPVPAVCPSIRTATV